MTKTLCRIKRSLRGCTFKWSLRLVCFEEGYDLDLFGFLIALPFLDRWHRMPDEIMDSWGPYWHEDSLVWTWGSKCWFFHAPWQWRHHKTWLMKPDGSWMESDKMWDSTVDYGQFREIHEYHYQLKSGEIQEAKATIQVEKMEWRWKWFPWLRFPRKVRQWIDVRFNREMGDRAGSWKGGTIGCSWDLKLGERPLDALRRMERERTFR